MDVPAVTITTVEEERASAVEALHAATAVYTAAHVVDALLERLGWPAGDRRLVDPSCGDGAFLERALERLLAARPRGFMPVGLIEGWEIHPGACADARSKVSAVLCRHGHSAEHASAVAERMVHNRDFLTDSPANAEWDIVAGNPPYLRASKIPDALRRIYVRHVPDFAVADMLYSFLERCSRTLTPSGRIGFVTCDRWLVNASAGRLRERLGERLTLAHTERLDVTSAFYRPKQRRAGSPPRVHPVTVVLTREHSAGERLTSDPVHPGVDASRYEGYPRLGELAHVRIAPWLGTHGIFVVDEDTAASLPRDELVAAVDTDDIICGRLATPKRYAIRTLPTTQPCEAILAHLTRTMNRMAARGRQGKFWMPPESFHAMDLSQESLLVPRIAKSAVSIRVPPGVLPINHNLSIVAADPDTLTRIEAALSSPLATQWVQDYAPRLEGGYFSLTTTLLRKLPIAN
ncbi:Eco57I restriction-modification methylase domain-containing protein [Burkholderia cepacia]|uniref:Eco57I restriction-modification methylase domain-containing protein n=1 Tax=Burkholderia cepacia TaxID=292 RepID=UPI002AB62193|nr:N-6 DNA methylase [Burkholderia cepacia]